MGSRMPLLEAMTAIWLPRHALSAIGRVAVNHVVVAADVHERALEHVDIVLQRIGHERSASSELDRDGDLAAIDHRRHGRSHRMRRVENDLPSLAHRACELEALVVAGLREDRLSEITDVAARVDRHLHIGELADFFVVNMCDPVCEITRGLTRIHPVHVERVRVARVAA